MEHYTYLHRRESDNLPFYVGKGKSHRAWDFGRRSKHWSSIAKKHGVKVEIIARWATAEEAFSHEVLLINCFRSLGYKLANATSGGDGMRGPTEEVRKKLSNAAKKQWEDSDVSSKEKRAESFKLWNKESWANSRTERISALMAAQPALSEKKRKLWAIPDYAKKQLEAIRLGREAGSSMVGVVQVETGIAFKSLLEAAKASVKPRLDGKMPGWNSAAWTISQAAKGKRIRAYGYTWRFLHKEAQS